MYQSAARTHVHVHVQDVHRQCKWLLNSALRADLHLLRHHISTSIVNLGTGYETLGVSKAGTIQSQLDVEPTVTLHNLLFLVRKLISNKLVEAFDWLSC